MNARQARFVAEYLVDLNATQAAIRAGYSPATAKQMGTENLSKPVIKHAIEVEQAKSLAATGLTRERVLEEMRRLAFADMRGFFNEDGSLKAIREMNAEQGSQLAGLEVIIKNAEAGDGHMDRVHKFKLWDKTRALEQLAKHFGLLVDKVEHSGGLEISWKDTEE
jgi:phage terminase small subunit